MAINRHRSKNSKESNGAAKPPRFVQGYQLSTNKPYDVSWVKSWLSNSRHRRIEANGKNWLALELRRRFSNARDRREDEKR